MLTLIGIPLGNIEDISLRQLKALFSLEIILAEDTRNYIKLRNILAERIPEIIKSLELDLNHKPELISYREQNHNSILPQILKLLSENKNIGLVSDAGMPTISDPGGRLVEEVLRHNFEVDVVPGPTAVETAISISGLPTDKFTFLGFLPRERGKIHKLLNSSIQSQVSIIFYESPFRVIKTLEIISELSEDIKVAACNDLTKKFQKIFRGNIKDVIEELKKVKVQGEWVIVLNTKSQISNKY